MEDRMAYAELLCEAALLNGAGRGFGGAGGQRSWTDVRDTTARVAKGMADRFAPERGSRVGGLMGPPPAQVLLAFDLSWRRVTVVPVNPRLFRADMRAVVAAG